MTAALALVGVFTVAGLFMRARRIQSQKAAVAILGFVVAALVMFTMTVPSAWFPWLVGTVFGIGILAWRDLDQRFETPWLLITGIGGGLLVYGLGLRIVPGVAGGLLMVWGALAVWDRPLAGDAMQVTGKVRPYRRHILVCYDGPCQVRGAKEVREALARDSRFKVSVGVRVTATSCLGYCRQGPVCWGEPEGTLYTDVEAPAIARLLVPDHGVDPQEQ